MNNKQLITSTVHKIIWSFIFSLSVNFCLYANNAANKIDRVLYITLDGVRWQNVFSDKYFKNLKANYTQANFYGKPDSNYQVEVASIPVSQPSYHSQMAGKVTTCGSNNCGRITFTTLPENLIQKLNLEKQDVAVFASWANIAYSAESKPGSIYTDIADQVRPEYRNDVSTFVQAKNYLIKYKPKFMWLSFADADTSAHAGNLAAYNSALNIYDDILVEIIELLKNLNIYDTTAVIITTDHGRGNGAMWTTHGSNLPESKRTWAITFNTGLIPYKTRGNTYYFNTLSMRPTIEKILFNSASIANM